VDFFWIAEAKGFCMLLTRPPWLDIAWQERIKHACKEKSLHGSIFLGKKQIRSLSPSKGTSPKKTRSLSLSKGTFTKKTSVNN
jgi:hypothetical protein